MGPASRIPQSAQRLRNSDFVIDSDFGFRHSVFSPTHPELSTYNHHPMPFSLLQPLRDLPIACVDTETTGASAAFGHKIIEIGIVRIKNGRKVARYQQLL